MTARTADIEIYLQAVSVKNIEHWLAKHFRVEPINPSGRPARRYRVALPNSPELPIEVLVVPDAVARGHYTSVWFRDNHTLWNDDLACAGDACQFFDAEVRCNISGWCEGDPESGWWLLSPGGDSQRIDWK